MLIYGLHPAPAGAPDVVSQEITEIVNDGAPRIFTGHEGDELSYNQGDNVKLSQVDIDDNSNRSQASLVFEFTATDTIPPPPAGAPGATLLREEP